MQALLYNSKVELSSRWQEFTNLDSPLEFQTRTYYHVLAPLPVQSLHVGIHSALDVFSLIVNQEDRPDSTLPPATFNSSSAYPTQRHFLVFQVRLVFEKLQCLELAGVCYSPPWFPAHSPTPVLSSACIWWGSPFSASRWSFGPFCHGSLLSCIAVTFLPYVCFCVVFTLCVECQPFGTFGIGLLWHHLWKRGLYAERAFSAHGQLIFCARGLDSLEWGLDLAVLRRWVGRAGLCQCIDRYPRWGPVLVHVAADCLS